MARGGLMTKSEIHGETGKAGRELAGLTPQRALFQIMYQYAQLLLFTFHLEQLPSCSGAPW